MNKYFFFICFLSLILLSACAGVRKETVQQPAEASEVERSPVLSFILNSRAGAKAELNDPTYGYVTIIVDEPYISATDTECKKARIFIDTDCMEVIAICKENDQWVKIPQIWSSCSGIR